VLPDETDDGDALKLHDGTVCELTVKLTSDATPSANTASAVQVPSCAAVHPAIWLDCDQLPFASVVYAL
jgi:hypothetical protein